MRFTKMHGAGNDFIIINNMEEHLPASALPALARKLCAPHTSIGADGLMVVTEAEKGGDYGMLFYNSDGSLGEMCGNGARCIARYGYENGLAGEQQRIETTAGLVTGQRLSQRIYRVRLNDPSLIDLHRKAQAGGMEYDCGYVELGDPCIPHAVLLMPGLDTTDRDALRALGRELRFSPAFPKGANVNFVKLLEDGSAQVLTYERGVEDFTLACGTGCGSVTVVLTLLGLVSGKGLRLRNEGGELRVSVSAEKDGARDILLSGPTNMVCTGEILDEDLAWK